MIYFQNIADLEHAKLRYRGLAKRLHPDKGGDVLQFQQMQEEYKYLLLMLQNKQGGSASHGTQQTNDIIEELRNLAKVLIQKQVPQRYLQKRIEQSQSLLERGVFSKLVEFLNHIEVK